MNVLWSSEHIHSLRWRLLGTICVAVLLIWLLTGWFGYTQAQHEAEELMDGNLAQTARLLLAIVHDNEANLGELTNRLDTVRGADDNIYEPPLEFQIGLGDGSILARSIDAPVLPILGIAGYSDIIRDKAAWRVLNKISTDGRYRVQVSQSIVLRDRAALEVAVQTVLPLLLIVPVMILLIYLSIQRALRPLDLLAREVSARTPDNLAALPDARIPTEARPLVKAINRLFQRVDRTLDNERRFTADAAHELRTPLAAIKVQTQVALLSGDTPMRQHALHQIECGVDRATRLVEQLLRLARLDPLSSPPASQPVDLSHLVKETVIAAHQAHPEATQEVREIGPAKPVIALGDADLLQIAIRNLLDNALRYTPPNSCIQIEINRSPSHCCLSISDNGPGVPAAALSRLGERFFRGQPGAIEGNGLGLAIVARIAELHGAEMKLTNQPNGGFSVSLDGLLCATADLSQPING